MWLERFSNPFLTIGEVFINMCYILLQFQIEIGVIYGCILDKLYVAVKGHGSYCGEEKLSVSIQDGEYFNCAFSLSLHYV